LLNNYVTKVRKNGIRLSFPAKTLFLAQFRKGAFAMALRKARLVAALIAALATFVLASPVEAAFRLRVEDITGSPVGVVITDETVTDGSNGSPGIITIPGTVTIGQFTVASASGFVIQPGAGGATAEMDLNNLSLHNIGSSAGTIRLTLEADGLTAPLGLATVRSSIGGTLNALAGTTFNANSYVIDSNAVPAFGADVLPPGALPALPAIPGGNVPTFPAGFSFTSTGVLASLAANSPVSPWTNTSPNTFSLVAQVTVAFSGAGGSVSFDFDTTTNAAPAPGGLVLAIAALPILGFGYIRRRMNRQSQVA